MATDASLRWNTILTGLQVATIIGQGPAQGTSFCALRQEVYHTRTLAYLHPPVTKSVTAPQTSIMATRRRQSNPCLSWSKGGCIFPGTCFYRHVCAICQLAHRARDCPRAPDTSLLPHNGVHRPARTINLLEIKDSKGKRWITLMQSVGIAM